MQSTIERERERVKDIILVRKGGVQQTRRQCNSCRVGPICEGGGTCLAIFSDPTLPCPNCQASYGVRRNHFDTWLHVLLGVGIICFSYLIMPSFFNRIH